MNKRDLSLETFCRDLALQKIHINDQIRFRDTIKEGFKRRIFNKTGQHITPKNFDKVISSEDLAFLLKRYDEFFFDNKLQKFALDNKCSITICFGSKCSKVAGRCFLRYRNRCYNIELAPITFKKAFLEQGSKESGGMECDDILHCLMLTFEHELIHAISGCFCYKKEGSQNISNISKDYGYRDSGPGTWTGPTSPKDGHSKTFMSILYNTFGQESYRHGLFKGSKRNKYDYKEIKKLLKKGDTVSFQAKYNKVVTEIFAVILKLNPKKAICEQYTGKSYIKWDVNYNFILKINNVPIDDFFKKKSNKVAEPPKRSSNKVAEPPKRSSNKLLDPPKRSSNKVTEPPKRSSNKVEELPKRSSNKVAEPPKRSSNKVAEPPKRSSNKVAEPPKRSSNKVAEPPNNSSSKKKIKIKVSPKNSSSKKKFVVKKTAKKVFKKKDEYPNSPKNWDGPHLKQYLKGIPKDSSGKTYKTIKNFDNAIKQADTLNKVVGGITKTSHGYSLRKGKVLIPSPEPKIKSGLASWLKK